MTSIVIFVEVDIPPVPIVNYIYVILVDASFEKVFVRMPVEPITSSPSKSNLYAIALSAETLKCTIPLPSPYGFSESEPSIT